MLSKSLFAAFLFLGVLVGGQLTAKLSKSNGATRYQILSGVKVDNISNKNFWDEKYSKANYVYGKAPSRFLAENYHYIPEGGHVLDLGMGEGRNAVFLARKSYKVTGIDISSVAAKKAQSLASEFGVRLKTIVASAETYKFKEGTFDAIICFYYVDRNLHDKMLSWLKPGGVLIYESYTDRQLNVRGYETYDARYLLRNGELLSMFRKLEPLKYEEPLHLKNFRASLIAKKQVK